MATVTFYRLVYAISITCAITYGMPTARATDTGTSGDWDFFVGGYLTMATIDAVTGTQTPFGAQDMALEMDFSELLDVLDYGFSALVVARKARLSLNADVVLLGISDSGSLTLPSPLSAAVNIGYEVNMKEIELYAGYALFEQYPDLEIIAGARYIDQEIDITVNAGPLAVAPTIGDDWIDPFVGLRYTGPIKDRWSFILRGDVGGFGVGSDFAWRIDAGVRYRWQNDWEVGLGYKILDQDYESGARTDADYYKWDGSESGLTLGFGKNF